MGAPKTPPGRGKMDRKFLDSIGMKKARAGDPSKNKGPLEFTAEQTSLRQAISAVDGSSIADKDKDRLLGSVDALDYNSSISALAAIREEFDALVGKGRDAQNKFRSLAETVRDVPGSRQTITGTRGKSLLS